MLRALNPVIRGWAAYYRTAASKEVYTSLDAYPWQLTYRWTLPRHPKKPRRWITSRYFGRFNPARQDNWVFGDRESGTYLVGFAWTKIIRHQLVRAEASPDDPALADYWADRRRKGTPLPLDRATMRLLKTQTGRCHRCGQLLLHADRSPQSPTEWEQWLRTARKAIKTQHIAY